MLARLRPRLTYANVVSTLALFVVLGGGAYAHHRNSVGPQQIQRDAVKKRHVDKNVIGPQELRKNSVRPVQLAPNAVRPQHIFDGSILTPKLADGAVTEAKLADGVAISGPQGPAGVKGDAGEQGPPGPSTGPAGGDLTGNYPNPLIADGSVTTAKLGAGAQGVALAGANVSANGTVRRSFNRFGGPPTMFKAEPGIYTVRFPGLAGALNFDNSIVVASLNGITAGMISRSANAGNPQIRTFNASGTATDLSFEIVVMQRAP